MKSETFSGTVESAYGKQLPSPVKFSGTFDAYENIGEIKSANDYPSDEDVLNFVNAKRKASARATATTEALSAAGIAKPDPKSPEVVRENLIKGLMALNNLSREQAEAALGIAMEAAKS